MPIPDVSKGAFLFWDIEKSGTYWKIVSYIDNYNTDLFTALNQVKRLPYRELYSDAQSAPNNKIKNFRAGVQGKSSSSVPPFPYNNNASSLHPKSSRNPMA